VIIVVMFFPGGLVELIRRGTGLFLKPPGRRRSGPTAVRQLATTGAPSTKATSALEQLLVIKDIDKHFDALHAVNSASITVPVGGIHGLIGPNGAGKTSLFNIISGFLDADHGSVDFCGTSLLELEARDRIRLGITRTFQQVAIFGDLSCIDNVIIGRGRNGVVYSMRESFGQFIGGPEAETARHEALDALESVGLADQSHLLAGTLSLGDQRRLEIARAVVSSPKLVLLDEPVSGIAETEVEELRQLLLRINGERKIAMLVVEHNIPFVAQLCHTISVMGEGSIVAEGSPVDVIALPKVRQLYFGEEVSA
jgi:branched-chain amino acid transport system permease protein